VCGAQQDNSTLCGPSRKAGGIDISDWYDVGGGESGYIAVRPDTPDIVFAGSYGGLLTRKDINTEFERDINPWPNNPMGHDAADAKYRDNKAKWTADSPEVKAVAKWSGAKAEDVPAGMALYRFPTLQEQQAKWLAKDGLAAKALAATAQFQLSQKQVEKTLPDYSVAVNPSYAAEAAK